MFVVLINFVLDINAKIAYLFFLINNFLDYLKLLKIIPKEQKLKLAEMS